MSVSALVVSTDVRPLLTVELTQKWYTLWLLTDDCRREEVDFGWLDECANNLDTQPSPYVNHVPNPAVVEALAAREGWTVDPIALDLLYGRWAIEVEGAADQC